MSRFKIPMNLQIFAEGAEAPEPAEPESVEPVNEAEETPVEEAPAEEEPEVDKNAIYAEARRWAEAEAKRQAAEENNRMFRDRFGSFNHPVTGKPISSAEEYFSALDYQEQQALQAQMQEKGIDTSLLDRAIQNSPVMREAQQIIENARIEEGNRELNEQIRQIGTIDPSVKGMDDLMNMPTFQAFDGYVRSGLSLVDAFKLANFETLSQKSAAASKQAAINAAKGKAHLSPVGGGGADTKELVEIPGKEIEMWKSVYPGLSYKELKEKYNRTL